MINKSKLLNKKVLILIVAYNAESTIQEVLKRIPAAVFNYDYEILILDDQSGDHTFSQGIKYREKHDDLNIKILYNPVNQGYGGNQKLGYQYAIDNNFDAVVLLHGDGQYAPEIIEDLFLPVLKGDADAVFGSRMAEKGKALKGGMPLYKYLGNRILSTFQNFLLGLGLSEYHSGYRVYSVETLKKINFQYNTPDFHFDTEIIIQLWLIGAIIREIPIPTYYGDEICRVNGIRYAWNVFKATIGVRMQQMQLCYQRKYDLAEENKRYPLKLGYDSSHTRALASIYSGAKVLDVGCGEGIFGLELQKKGCEVWGIDDACLDLDCQLERYEKADLNSGKLPFNPGEFDFVVMLDVLEHLNTISIYQILDYIREKSGHGRTRIIISTANISFIIMRMQLLLGNFNYGKRGILDYTHRHLFTKSSLTDILEQCGFQVHKTTGISPPFPAAVGDNWLSRMLLKINNFAIKVWPEMFSYQFFVEATAFPTSKDLLADAQRTAESMQKKMCNEKLSPVISAIIITAAVTAVYLNSLGGVWIFDDEAYILKSTAIRNLWPPSYMAGNSRPLLFLTLALNYAISGYNILSYHIVDIIIHILNSLLLFGIVRATLNMPALKEKFKKGIGKISLFTGLLWGVHPVTTMCVSYTWQRGEQLMAFFYMLTLFLFIKGCQRENKIWFIFSVISCLCGMASKEVMVSAPIMLLLYDRAFISGSFMKSLSRRKIYYTACALCWVLLFVMVANTAQEFHSNKALGFKSVKCTPLEYLITMPGVYLHYFRLAIIPHPLIFDYDWKIAESFIAELPKIIVMSIILILTIYGIIRNKSWGVAASVFFMLMMPTTSFMPMPDALIEYRIYLPLAVIAAAAVPAVAYYGSLAAAKISDEKNRAFIASRAGTGLPVLIIVIFGLLTINRNFVYHSELGLWADTVKKCPQSYRSQINYGRLLTENMQPEKALIHLQKALELCSTDPEIHLNMGNTLFNLQRYKAAEIFYRQALELKPEFAKAHNNLANTLSFLGKFYEALQHFKKAVALSDTPENVYVNIGCAYARRKVFSEAIKNFQKSIEINPDYADAWFNLGIAYRDSGNKKEAARCLQKALKLNPGFKKAENELIKLR